jgi:hypothetical protein
MEVETNEPVQRKIQVVYAVVRARDFAIQREEQRDRMFGDGIGASKPVHA